MRLLLALILTTLTLSAADQRPPNVVIILLDDLGYADMGCFGAEKIKTPNMDRMAAEGMKFTSFYVAQAVCSASRAALMTGCYANRVGMQGALNHTSKEGIHPDEWLLPEMCKARGYATAAFGKWHLGTDLLFNPLHHGFDEFLGIPYSNDNSKYHPSLAQEMPPLPLYDGLKVIETDPDQSLFTHRFTAGAMSFIEQHKDQPFFLYVPHVMPHVPIFASADFRGKSSVGLYGDVVQELDWSVGQILDTLKRCDIDHETLVILPQLRQSRWQRQTAARRQAHDLRWRRAQSFHCPLARPCARNSGLRRTGDGNRPAAHHLQPDRREALGPQNRRQKHPPSAGRQARREVTPRSPSVLWRQ